MKAGPMPIPAREMTPEKLASAIHEALSPICTSKATEIAHQMSLENGVDLGVSSLYNHLPLSRLTSALNSTHPARYHLSSLNLQISHNVAQVLACAGAITEEDLLLHRTVKWEIPDDHDKVLFSGALKTTWEGFTGVITDTAAGVKEAMKEENKTSKDKSIAVGKGFAKGVGKAVFFPFRATALTLNELSDGMVRVPAVWDPYGKVRKGEPVRDFKSGAAESGKALFLGIYDGVADFFVKPYEYGKREEGNVALGVAKGLAVGSGNFLWKPLAGSVRSVALFGRGIQKEIMKKKDDVPIKEGSLGTGEGPTVQEDWRKVASELSGYEEEECEGIVRRFLEE
ncbi:hypothetical protein HK097_006516, partial [Rhizophlyctis rosea]